MRTDTGECGSGQRNVIDFAVAAGLVGHQLPHTFLTAFRSTSWPYQCLGSKDSMLKQARRKSNPFSDTLDKKNAGRKWLVRKDL